MSGRLLVMVLIATACGGSRETKLCKQLTKLCGEDLVPDTCASDLADGKDKLGESWDKIASCANEAKSCPEVAGCFVGGISHAIDRWVDQFNKGAERAHGRSGKSLVDPGARCKGFTGSSKSAKWTQCDDEIIREISCETFIDDLQCKCRLDGVEQTFFHATDPPLDDRRGAARVAANNCGDDAKFRGL